ncbi:CvpA family protein [Staphylococcus caprae]|uniref:CvpA family protein n=1 Tax=Staphylococcus caprae TaxID=29380 RepID=UPI0024B5782A|nr:CvpA family protein [Staphylococcus caprae]MDI9231224.1 CvpA family protein [Staphylococcus caprae]
MIFDFIVIIIIAYFMVIGFRRGIWLSTLHFISSIVSLWNAYQFYQPIAKRLIVFLPFPKTVAYDTEYAIHFNSLQQRFENIVAFILLVILIKLILYLIIVTFDKIVAYKKLHLVSRIMGVILGILMSLIVIQIGLYLISLYPDTFIQNQISQSLLCKRWILNMPFVSHFILNL